MATVDFAKTERLVKTFTPTQPISLPDLLAGRLDLLYRLQADTHTLGQHVLLYGDRGVGKTSIARVLAAIVGKPDDDAGIRSFFVSCDTSDVYGSIWQKVLRQLTFTLRERQIGFVQDEDRQRVVGLLDQPIESPSDIQEILESLPYPTVIVIDEYDRVACERTRMLMADTLKLFSDFGTECTVVLVGVGGSIQQLIEAHESVLRNVDFVHVETMSPEELAEIIDKGFSDCGMEYEPGLEYSIAKMSQGYPHYTHLLGLWAGMGAVERDGNRVTSDDLARAVPRSIQNAVGGIRLEYERATDSPQPNNLFKQALLACAMAEKDDRGRFVHGAVREPLQRILDREVKRGSYQRHLTAFCDNDHGPTLIKSGRRGNFRWHFANPQLIPFVYLRGITDGLITGEDLP